MEGGERHEVECGVEGEAEQMKKEDEKASLGNNFQKGNKDENLISE